MNSSADLNNVYVYQDNKSNNNQCTTVNNNNQEIQNSNITEEQKYDVNNE